MYNAEMALSQKMSEEKFQQIKNIVQELNKSSMDLASTVLEMKGE